MMWSRKSRHERGYGTAWDKLRAQVLLRDCYICHCPECQGGRLRVKPANEVDHIKPKAQGGTDAWDNLRAINRECHRRITYEQMGKTIKPKVQISPSGWPM